jgi:ubiquinone/menaquinone biosynthesis C-methylase UbiE
MITTAEWLEDFTAVRYRNERIDYWDKYAKGRLGRYYHEMLRHVYRALIPPGKRVLEIGCGEGDLLATLEPSVGVGIDFSPHMIAAATRKHPELVFVERDAHDTPLDGPFDYIILSDLVNDLWDIQLVLHQVARASSPHTRIIINTYSRLWELPLLAAARLHLCRPLPAQNWLTLSDLTNMLYLANMEVIRSWQEVLCPVAVPGIGKLCNRYLTKLWPFCWGALTNFLVARLAPDAIERPKSPPSVTVVVPARNEAGNIEQIFRRVPEMGCEGT